MGDIVTVARHAYGQNREKKVWIWVWVWVYDPSEWNTERQKKRKGPLGGVQHLKMLLLPPRALLDA